MIVFFFSNLKTKILVIFTIFFITHIYELNAQLLINEFLASNVSVNTDPDIGLYSDWIEILNTSGESVDCSGFFLTDDLNDNSKWAFPAGTVIAPGSYVLIWADGLDTVLTGIHTNFKLSNTGEEIGLFDSNSTLIDSVSFQSQIANISKGRKPVGSSIWEFFTIPTPGQINNTNSYNGISPEPEFSVQGGLFSNPVSVEISCVSPTAEIRYTTDGSLPNINSPVYTSPVIVSSISVIRAISVEQGNYLPGRTVSQTYYISSSNFELSLPIITINTAGQNISPDYKINAHMAVINKDTAAANDFDGRITIKIRGSSSQMFPKKQYRLETQTESGDNCNVSILGMPAENDWILYAPYSDKSLMRNVLAYDLAGQMDRYAPRTRYCEVFLNDEYIGVYSLVEKIKRDVNRINIDQLNSYDNSEPRISGGYIFKRDRGDQLINTQSGVPLVPVYPDEIEITTQQINWLQNHLNSFESTLSGNISEIENYADVISFVDNFLAVEAFKNIDGYRLSTFFYKDRYDKIVSAPIWDYNLSMGNADYLDGGIPEGWYIEDIQNDYQSVYWWLDLFNNSEFWDLSSSRWIELRQSIFNIDYIYNMIDDNVYLLNQAQQRNFSKWPILGEYVWPNYFIGETYVEEIDFMKQFLLNRFLWIDSQFGLSTVPVSFDFAEYNKGEIKINDMIQIDSCHTGLYIADEAINLKAIPYPSYSFQKWEFTDIEITTSVVIDQATVWKYLDNGSNQMNDWYQTYFDDSSWPSGSAQLGYGDGDESTVVSYGPDPNNKYVTTYFRKNFTVNDPDEYQSLLLRLLRDDGAVVYLNGQEIQRSNMPSGTIDYMTLASSTVSGGSENAFYEYTIDPDLLVAGSNLLAVEIHQANQTSSDISFDLELMGVSEEIIGTPVVVYEGEIDTAFSEPTLVTVFFEEINSLIDGIYINEVMASNNSTVTDEYGEYDDWIELYNSTDEAINIAGLYLTDDLTIPDKWQIPSNSLNETVIDPNGFIVLWADNTIQQGALHLNFKLSKSGESVGVSQFFNEQMTFLDNLTFSEQTDDISFGRYPDGNDNWVFFTVPTPNSSNMITSTEDILSNSVSFENYPNPFNEFTTIKLSIAESENIFLAVYDMSGRQINTLCNEYMSAGDHFITWYPYQNGGSEIKQGLYFLKLQTNDYSKTLKLILLN